MNILSRWTGVALLILCSCAWADCPNGERYRGLARTAQEESRDQDALKFLQKAVEACSAYQYWQELAEFAASLGEQPEARQTAIGAYDRAYELASTSAEEARTAGRYAELLFAMNDPQRAKQFAYYAKNAAPDDPWVQELVKRINDRLNEVRPADIMRGLGDVYRHPPNLYAIVDGPVSGGGGKSVPKKRTAVSSAEPSKLAVDVPINFEFNSVQTDARTSKNIVALAKALADAKYSERRFVFVGHSDLVGEDSYNKELSKRRAEAIFEQVIAAEPTLKGRITIKGKGNEAPLLRGTSDEDNRANRRLEVNLLP